MRFNPKSLTPNDRENLRHWPAAAKDIRSAYHTWCTRMEAAQNAFDAGLLETQRDGADLVLRTPVGEVISFLTFVADGPLPIGRVLLVRPADITGRKPRVVFCVTISDEGFVYTGDDRTDPWPNMGNSYAWGNVERFLQQLMLAVVRDEAEWSGYGLPGGLLG